MDALLKDLRYALRNLAQARGFSVVAIVTLALGIGAITAMFSVVNSVLLRPLPYPEPERLTAIAAFNTTRPTPTIPEGAMSYPDVKDIEARNHSFSAITAHALSEFTITGIGQPLHAEGEVVSANTFQLLGVTPALGRAFLPGEDGPGHHVAIISDGFWRAHFNGDKSVLGKSIGVNGRSYTIVGVAPAGFQFPVRAHPLDLWTTFSRMAEVDDPKDQPETSLRNLHSLRVLGRLKPGITVQQANQDLHSIDQALAKEFPDSNTHEGFAATRWLDSLVGDTRRPLLVLMGAVALVLLIACANVANLLLARSTGRMREIAIRSALGATRSRVVRQLLTESLLLAFAGAAAGIALAHWALAALLQLYPENLPRAQTVGIDRRVLLFTIALSALTGILFGLLPAWRASAPDLTETMREGGRTSTSGVAHGRLRSALVVAQTALGVMLLIGAGLLLRSFQRLAHADTGVNPSHVLTANFDLSESRYKPDQIDAFNNQLLARLRALPGVVNAAGAMPMPMSSNDGWSIQFDLKDHPLPPAQRHAAGFFEVTDGFFETMQIPLVEGRTFDARDSRNAAPVMVISQSFARQYFPDTDPIGHYIEIGAGEGPSRERYKTREIIGVVGDIRTSRLDITPFPTYYIPISQLTWGTPTLTVRTVGNPTALAPSISKILNSMDPDTALYEVRSMEDWLALDLGRARFQTVLLSIFAAIALLLTAIGVYGVVAYSAAQRTHEIGVRMALGAGRRDVLSMMLAGGVRLTLAGLGIGVLGALALARVIAALLYEVPPRDPLTYALVCGVLGGVALLATWMPSYRAARVDPMIALRYE